MYIDLMYKAFFITGLFCGILKTYHVIAACVFKDLDAINRDSKIATMGWTIFISMWIF